MNVIGKSHIGLVRSTNQDMLFFEQLDDCTAFALVCDGMGGANGGNVASDIAVHVLSQRIRQAYADNPSFRSPEYILASAMAAANVEIFDKGRETPELSGMGTTVVAVILQKNIAYISHVGDSRLYQYRHGELQVITRDHSVVQDMIEKGQLTEQQARCHPRRNFITRALGVQALESGEYDELKLEAGDKLLLCTDGLTNMVDIGKIKTLLQLPAEEAVEKLIEASLQGGGTDNITAVLITVDDDDLLQEKGEDIKNG